MTTSKRTPKPRKPRPTPQAETSDQRLIRAFETVVADVASLVAHAHDATTTSDIVNAICARHRALALDPPRVRGARHRDHRGLCRPHVAGL
jgi:hypothetical protein